MIKNKKDLQKYIQSDNDWLLPKNKKEKVLGDYAAYPSRYLKKYLYYLRKQEYFINTYDGNRIKGFLSFYYERKKNKLGTRLGVEIGPNCFESGLNIYHIGSVIVNPGVKAGKNCSLHGANCIGNNGLTEACPVLGNNVDIGYGAVVIGDIKIADNIKIGANAVVNRSFLEPGCTIVGVPAKVVKKGDNDEN